MARLLEISALAPGSLVLDPFLGSGTTARAAKDAGLRCVGIEAEERYCEMAVRRLAQGVFV
jgi:DNA modification methylase